MRPASLAFLAFCACGGSSPIATPGAPAGEQLHGDGGVVSGTGSGWTPDGGDGSVTGSGRPDGGDPDLDGELLPLRHSPIADENRLRGSEGWKLDAPSDQIAAYADRTSTFPGDSVVIHAGASIPAVASWQLWRLGYYGGAGGRKLAEGGPGQVPLWTSAILDSVTGAASASWPATFIVSVPPQAVTGAYLVKISSPLGQTYATFVVREPARAAVILYPMSTNTYQAYNAWGGTSLYNNFRSDWSKWHAFAVSFDRPYLQNHGSGELLSKDRDFIIFAEAQGYDLAYVTDSDLDADPLLVARRRMVLYQGHSEYWTAAMYDASEKAIEAGANMPFSPQTTRTGRSALRMRRGGCSSATRSSPPLTPPKYPTLRT